MLALSDQIKEPFVATDEEALIAREALAKLKPLAEAKTDIKLRVAEKADVVVPLKGVDAAVSAQSIATGAASVCAGTRAASLDVALSSAASPGKAHLKQ